MQSALYGIKGVESAEVSLASADALVVYDSKQVTVKDLEKAIKESGYGVEGHSTPKPVKTVSEQKTTNDQNVPSHGGSELSTR